MSRLLFPLGIDDDPEDVAWALSTGDALWRQGERLDAVVWLRRAANSAVEAGYTLRAGDLSRAAADLMRALEDGDFDSLPPDVHLDSVPPAKPPQDSIEITEDLDAELDESDLEEDEEDEGGTDSLDSLLAQPVTAAAPQEERVPTEVRPTIASRPDTDVLRDSSIELIEEPDEEPTVQREAPQPIADPTPAFLPTDPPFPLGRVPLLQDLDPSKLRSLAKAAQLELLGKDDEVPLQGMALIVRGSVAVQATVADATAMRLEAEQLVVAKGSLSDCLALRLVAAEDGVTVATWSEASMMSILGEDEAALRSASVLFDRMQALAGACMGPLGDRLDEALRNVAIDRLSVRVLAPQEVLAEQGKPVPGMAIVGVGNLHLFEDGEEVDKLGAGDFLFASQVLGGEAAPSTAKAGLRGAIVLFGKRALAQELLVSCPPLLEIFAGM